MPVALNGNDCKSCPSRSCSLRELRSFAPRTAEGGCPHINRMLFVTVDGFHGEGGEADGDVFGAAFVGSGVADPLAGVGNYGLSGGDVDRSVLVFYAQRAFEDDGELVEGGSLTGFEPSGGTAHVGYAGG